MIITNEEVIKNLKLDVSTYDDVVEIIKKRKQRIKANNPGSTNEEYVQLEKFDTTLNGIKGKEKQQGLLQLKGKVARDIEKMLIHWPLHTEWLSEVPGIGSWLSGKLILLYYYRFLPVCPECETSLIKQDKTFFCTQCQKGMKGGGLLQHKLEIKDFAKISSWWHYMGRHIEGRENHPQFGTMPKWKAGLKPEDDDYDSWSPEGRVTGYHIGDQFNRQKETHPYKAFLLKQKRKHLEKNNMREKPWSKGHIHNAAKNEAIKLFLSHMWVVARTIDELSVTEPYIGAIKGHTVIPPYYWNGNEV